MFALAECEPHMSILGCIPSKYAACDPRMHQHLVALDSGRDRPIGVPNQPSGPVRRPAHGLAKSIQPTVAARAAVGAAAGDAAAAEEAAAEAAELSPRAACSKPTMTS